MAYELRRSSNYVWTTLTGKETFCACGTRKREHTLSFHWRVSLAKRSYESDLYNLKDMLEAQAVQAA